jgi:hypothetical protein
VVDVRLGAGILIALAAGAAAAGPWVLAAIALSGLLAMCSLPAAPAPGWITTLAGLARVSVFASAFGCYVFPAWPGLAAAVLVIVVLAAGIAGVPVPEALRRWIAGALVLAAAVLVALCLAIRPVDVVAPLAAPPVGGLLLAVAVMFPLLARPSRAGAIWWICGSTAVALAVAAAALYQLGPVRLGLSVTSLRDLLAAADAVQFGPLLTVVAVLATVPAALTGFAEARTGLPRGRMLACGIGVAAVAALAGPVVVLLLAAVPAFAEVLAGFAARYRGNRG